MPLYEIGEEEDMDVGYYDIGDSLVGDDIEALLGFDVGAPRRAMVPRRGVNVPGRMVRSAAARRAMANALAMRQAQQGTLLREMQPTKSRQYPLGFDSVTTVAAGATVPITARPQVIFRPERLVVSAGIAGSFLINDLRVGKNSQFASAGAVPADAFGPNAFQVLLKCDTAQVSADIVLNVTNTSLGALRFTAVLIGDAVE